MKIIFFSLFFLGLSIQTINVNSDYLDEDILELEDSEYFVIQEVKNGTFYFQVSAIDVPKYLFVELIFLYPGDGDVNLAFTITQNNLTKLINNQAEYTYADENGFYLKKSYQNIVINANSFRSGDKFFITNLIRTTNVTYQYNIRISRHDTKPCPNNCTASIIGTCEDGVCVCDTMRVDLDCSKKAQLITKDNKISHQLVDGTQYYYFEQTTQESLIVLDIGIETIISNSFTEATIYVLFEDFEIGMPTPSFSKANFSVSQFSFTNPQKVDVSGLQYMSDINRFRRLLLTIVTDGAVQMYFDISSPSEDSSVNTNLMLIYFLVSLGVVLLLTWIIVTLIRYRQSKNRIHDEERLRQQQQSQIHLNQRKNGITISVLDQYMPKIFYKNLHKHPKIIEKKIDVKNFEACTICLLEYEKESICRVSPCIHVLHADCLQEWMVNKKHETCPMCRNELNEQALEKYANEEKEKDKEKIDKQNFKTEGQIPRDQLMVVRGQH